MQFFTRLIAFFNCKKEFAMSYKTLRKAFHDPKTDADALFQQRFSASNTIHLEVTIAGNQAFCFMDDALYTQMLSIAKADKTILALSQQLPGQALQQFIERTLIDEIVLTNGIEGVNSSRKEIGDILRSLEKQNKRKRFYGLVNKYAMLTQGKTVPMDTLEDIRALYDDLVLAEVKADRPDNVPDGRLFRKESVSVYNASGVEIHQGLQPESKIESYLNVALSFLHDDSVDTLIKAAIFHYLLGFIHPFYDGNGRLNRFISSALLLQEYEPLVGLRLSYATTQLIEKYYKGFTVCNDPLNRGDITPFVLMFLEVVKQAVDDIVSVLEEKRDLLEVNLACLSHLNELSESREVFDLAAILLQVRMFSGSGISIHQLMELFHVSRPTIMKRLEGISALGLLEREKAGREVNYQLNLDLLAQIADQAEA